MPEGRNMVDNVLLPSGEILILNGAKVRHETRRRLCCRPVLVSCKAPLRLACRTRQAVADGRVLQGRGGGACALGSPWLREAAQIHVAAPPDMP